MESGTPRREPGPARRQATVLESVEEIRAQVRASSSRTVQEVAPRAGTDRVADETPVFRPVSRPPMALLHVLDDGDTTGEVIRIRGDSFLIGRVEGNLIIPHDSGMSGRHAEIVRRNDGRAWSWHLRDLGSTNGTFVRASTVLLHQDQEFMVGTRLFRFDAPVVASAAEEPSRANATRKWEVPSRAGAGGLAPGMAPACLVEISKGAELCRHALTGGEIWLGRDPSRCAIVVDDPFVDPRHARIYRDEKGRWVVANQRSRNGVWGRASEVALERGGYFQCGEQRFLLKAL
ncbi:FHA domain-containing protein [Singulisphaera sp. Ch08]|uniref:FHA domain-containing protein n=1 Tax=Singulisphaera sp. Ch08 TaxID=3120278 RepID=A0AAU7CJX8_9BACT